MSRVLGIIGLIAAAAGTIGGLLESIRPQYALILAGIGAGLTAFTERVQGGASKVQ